MAGFYINSCRLYVISFGVYGRGLTASQKYEFYQTVINWPIDPEIDRVDL